MSDPLEIAVLADTPLFSMRVPLDGIDYNLTFDYVEREDRFYLSVFDTDGTAIAQGVKVVCNWRLLRRCADPRRPAGNLIAYAAVGDSPGLRDIGPGRRVKILYFPRDSTAPLTTSHRVGTE